MRVYAKIFSIGDNYMEINKRQRDKDIAQVKDQEKYDNDWGYIR